MTSSPGPAADLDQTASNTQSPSEKPRSQNTGNSNTEIAITPNQASLGCSKTNSNRASQDLNYLGGPNGTDIESQKVDHQLSGKTTHPKSANWINILIPSRLSDNFDKEPRGPKSGYRTRLFSILDLDTLVPPLLPNVKILIILQLVVRLLCFYLAFVSFINPVIDFVLLVFSLIAWILRHEKIYGLGIFRIPSPAYIWKIWKYPQWYWELLLVVRLNKTHQEYLTMLSGDARWIFVTLNAFWWTIYLLVSDRNDFEQNFVNAWRMRAIHRDQGVISAEQSVDVKYYPGRLTIFIGDEYLKIPMFMYRTENDGEVLEQLNMWYKYFKVRRGLFELIIPRSLSRIDCVKIEGRGAILPGTATQTLDCGRGLVHFHKPTTVHGEMVIEKIIQDQARPENRETQGLEFVRRLDRRAIIAVILTPSLLSAVVVIVWLAVYLRKSEKDDDTVDVQAVTTAAFTMAAYLVTAGAFVTALAAYFDSVQNNDEYASNERNYMGKVDRYPGKDEENEILKVEVENLTLQLQQKAKSMEQLTMKNTYQATGLTNTGNDCFVLASLQCLSNCPSFVQACQTWLESTQDGIGALQKSAILLLEALYAVNQSSSINLNQVRGTYDNFVKELMAYKDTKIKIFKIPAIEQQDANDWLMWFLGPEMLAAPAEDTLETEVCKILRCTDKDCEANTQWSHAEAKAPTIPVNFNGEEESSLDGLFRNSGFHEWNAVPEFNCPKCGKPSCEDYSYAKASDSDIIIQLVRSNEKNQKSNATLDFDVDSINLPVEDGKMKGYYVRAIEHHKGTKDSGHYTAYLRKDMNTRFFDEKNDDTSKKIIKLDKTVNQGAYILYCSPKPVIKAGATNVAMISKNKQPMLPNETLADASVSSNHNELPPRDDTVNQTTKTKLQQVDANKTTDSTLTDEAKEHAITCANKDHNADACKAAEIEKITNTTETQKSTEVVKASVADLAEKSEAV